MRPIIEPIKRLVVHCSFTKTDQYITAAEIRRWHTSKDSKDPSKPWEDIGYHYVVGRAGNVESGRETKYMGAHASGYNHDSIGICLVGGMSAVGQAEFNYTSRQLSALWQLLWQLSKKHERAKVCGHRDLDSKKTCPNFDVKAWFYDL